MGYASARLHRVVHRCSCENEGGFNMAPHAESSVSMYSCGEKRLCHTETDAANRCNQKTQSPPVAVVWCAVNRHTHIKREHLFCL